MTLKEYHNLKRGDLVKHKKRIGKIKGFFGIDNNLVVIEYIDTHREVYKSYRQIHQIEE